MVFPIVGRLNYSEYQALIIGLIFLILERLLRVVTFFLPSVIVKCLQTESQRLFTHVYKDERTPTVKLLQRIDNFKELVNYWGYPVEEHIVRTQDNFLLGLQRIPHGKTIPDDDEPIHVLNTPHNYNDNEVQQQNESIESVFKRCGISLNTIRHPDRDHDELFNSDDSLDKNSNSAGLSHMTDTQKSTDDNLSKRHATSSIYSSKSMNSREKSSELNERRKYIKPVVLFFHGLMTCSELWACNYEYENRLCCLLADAGYDVWFGNSRGNKYSMKHVKYDPNGRKFWDYSMDELSLYDLPDTINYILETTGAPSLSYIGFSQGTAQCFAALSINPKINDKINLFIALAPATSPKGLSNSIVNAFIKTSPNIIYLFFGRKAILTMVLFWQRILPPTIFTKIVDFALKFLFGWTRENINETQKAIGYYHLFSCSSVKSVVHWFQIIRAHSFQMYDELPTYSYTTTAFGKSCQRFPTKQITTPIAIFYGGRDSLADMTMLLEQIPKPVLVREIAEYEHLDFIWASDINHKLFPVIFYLLRKYNVIDDRDFVYSSDEPSDIEQNYNIFDYDDYDNDNQSKDDTYQQPEVIQRSTKVGEHHDNESLDRESQYDQEVITQNQFQEVSEYREGFDSKSYNSNEVEQGSSDESDQLTREIIYQEDYYDDDDDDTEYAKI
ncbi:alpha/beta-hydrolase [Gigaspora margarita]|uniref:Alpha/beta-hydrolase n=1 Tax=Gigaspora margarita TaxID=4874 RepID=A0A8H4A2H3_GIGMA|nr:alpha/beta-hydrolase [Gigaspora margarita]